MRRVGVFAVFLWLSGCGASGASGDAATRADGATLDAALQGDAGPGAEAGSDAAAADDAGSSSDPRDRLLATYLAFLDETPDVAQSNGLRGADVASVCELWDALDPSSQATYLTLTARLAGSHLADGSPALEHVVRLYRVTGGEGASASDPGSCGGGEFNRMIVSTDGALHDALVAANNHRGAAPYDLADVQADTSWRDSHDLAGPHAPFDLSDETGQGAPRGQVQFFRDPSSSVASAPLGRTDLAALVDPFAMELDQDYDCVHASNPLCTYVTYGPACLPQASALGTEIYGASYGAVDLGWRPAGCP